MLKLLGESPSGNCCELAAAIRDLGYLPPTSNLPQDGRANRNNLQSGYTADLREQISASLGRLKDALSDLARELRQQVQGPKGRDQKAALRIDQQTVRSGFVVGFLGPTASVTSSSGTRRHQKSSWLAGQPSSAIFAGKHSRGAPRLR